MCQVLNLQENESDQLAEFLGHDIRVYRQYYHLPQETLQLTKMSKVLLAVEKGRLSQYKGQSLDNIEIDPEEKIDSLQEDMSSYEDESVHSTTETTGEDGHATPETSSSLPATSSSAPLDQDYRGNPKRKWEDSEVRAAERHMMCFIHTCKWTNHTVERIWPEINQRVNYPVKMALVQMIDQETLDLDDQLTRYCTSNLSCQVSSIGVQRAVQAWNAHRIPVRYSYKILKIRAEWKGIPNVLAQEGCRKRVPEDLLPGPSAAADRYRQEMGNSLTRESIFGTDPFHLEEEKIRAETQFSFLHPDLEVLFNSTLNPSTIYLVDENGAILFPNPTGYIDEQEMGDRCEVAGDEEGPSTSTAPLSHGPPTPTHTPRFSFSRTTTSASLQRPPPPTKCFSKSIYIGRVEAGTIHLDGGTMIVDFSEREATVPIITEKVKHYLRTEEAIVLCDIQGNRILEGTGTTGPVMWKLLGQLPLYIGLYV
ncbi:hypothetical protein L3Q82_000075 [Scortum barcoo]|uniref:Uncharacterized protein n=1 Tax=Scortum barcoo TaxID=214431 RepID=A0ACB8X9V5_9TELE|nr:hypothetical protein L3Q82_000075 [Scortum barcoo]